MMLNSGVKTVVPLTVPPAEDVERSGQKIVALLSEVAAITKETFQRALDTADNLANQLHTSDERIKTLESELRSYKERAERAEQWLARARREIDERFFWPKRLTVAGRGEQRPAE